MRTRHLWGVLALPLAACAPGEADDKAADSGADTAAAACEPDGVGFDAGTLLLPADVGDSALVGAEVAAAGDVDGDGFGDVLVTQVTPPAVRLHRGGPAGLGAAPDLIIALPDGVNARAEAAGDVNGDAYPDVVIRESDTSVFVLLGGPGGLGEVRHPLGLPADLDPGPHGTGFGWSLAGLGDIDGDGHDDIAVGAYLAEEERGVVALFHGGPDGPEATARTLLRSPEAAPGDDFGWSVAAAGDVDADGHRDLVVGAFLAPGGAQHGEAWLFRGGPAGIDGDGARPLRSDEADEGSFFGQVVAGGADLDGDGHDDLAFSGSAPAERGQVVLGWGAAAGVALDAPIPSPEDRDWDHFGRDLDMADLNGDGCAELVVGAFGGGAADRGVVWVLPGTAAGPAAPLRLDPAGTSERPAFGAAVAAVGDVNGDGLGDVVVGALRDGAAGFDRGSITLFLGRRE